MKIALALIAVILGFIFVLKSCGVKKRFSDSSPVKYVESMPLRVESAKDAAYTANKIIIEDAIRIYRSQEGSSPAQLSDLVSKGYLQNIPQGNWKYDGRGSLE